MEEDLIKFWEIRRGVSIVEVYALGVAGSVFYVVIKEDSPSRALCRELQTLERENLSDIVKYREARGVFGNEYPRARAAVEYILENKLINVDEAKYVGPEYDSTIPTRAERADCC